MSDLTIRMIADTAAMEKALQKTKEELKATGESAERLDKIAENFAAIESSAKMPRAKIAALKKEMTLLLAAGGENTELYKMMGEAAKGYKDVLDRVAQATKGVTGANSELEDSFEEVKEQLFDMKSIMQKVASTSGLNLGGLPSQLMAITGPAAAATAAVGAAATLMYKAAKAAGDLEVHLDALEALTGLDAEGMNRLSDSAIAMSKKFGTSATGIVDAMALIGSQAPELLSSAQALSSVTDAANTLARAAGIDVVDAAKGITTVINQMGVSAARASDIINTLAAGSQKGSADVAYLQTAFEKSGTIASQAGLSFEQLAGAIETIAPKFSSAEVAGTSLSAVFKSLEKQTEDDIKPSVVGINTALDNLAAKELTTAEQMKLFGDAGYAAAVTLIQNRDQFKSLTDEMTGTQTAYEQMTIVTDNFEGKMAKLNAIWEAFLIAVGKSRPVSDLVDLVESLMEFIGGILEDLEGVINGLGTFPVLSRGVDHFSACLKILADVIHGIAIFWEYFFRLIGKGLSWVKDQASAFVTEFRKEWSKLIDKLENIKVFRAIADAWRWVRDEVISCIKTIKNYWQEFKKWLGVDSDDFDLPEPTTNPAPENPDSTGDGNEDDTKGTPNNGLKQKSQTLRESIVSQLKLNKEKIRGGELDDEGIKALMAQNKELEKQLELLDMRVNLSQMKAEGITLAPVDAKAPVDLAKSSKPLPGDPGFVALAFKINTQEWDMALAMAQKLKDEVKAVTDSLQGDTARMAESFNQLGEVLRSNVAKMSDKVGASLATVGNSLEAVGAGGAVAKAGATLAAIGQIILGFATASAIAAEKTGPFGWLAFTGAGLGALATMISTIKGYAAGGIITGGPMHGDRILARVNAGEMVLTRRQQGNLFNLLDGGAAAGATGGGEVTFEIHGDTLYGVLSNYLRKMGKL